MTTKRLGELATYINGYAFKPEDWGQDGLPIIRIQDLTGTSYQTNYYAGEYPAKIEINDGDVLVSWSASLGVYVWNRGKALLNQHIFKVVFDKESVDKRYFVYAVQHNLGKMALKMHGATMKHIVKSDFDNIEVPFPEIDEQKAIANILMKAEKIVRERKRQLAELDTLAKARFVELFGDVIINDRAWDRHTFSEITTSRLGKMLDAKKQSGEQSYSYLANFNVQWFRFDFSSLNKMDFDEKDRAEFELRDGDLLVCEGGEIGRCAIWHNEIQPCFFQKALHRVRCNKEVVLPEYLAWWFKYNCEHDGFAAIEGAKATISHLPGAKLKMLQVCVPPLALQNQFADFVRETEKTRAAVRRGLAEAERLFASLMQEYFST